MDSKVRHRDCARYVWGVGTVGLIALLLILAQSGPPADPVVQGAPMSLWVSNLTQRWTGAHGKYGYPPGVRAAIQSDREAAIVQLIAAVGNNPGVFDSRRISLAKRAPQFLRRILIPQRPRCRWAGVMALSHLAYAKADARIGRVFRECITDPDPLVRKIAAYEMGPWIFPDDPEMAARLLKTALNDPVADVRRDACRRIAMTDIYNNHEYVACLLRLRDTITALSHNDTRSDVRYPATEASRILVRADLLLATTATSQ